MLLNLEEGMDPKFLSILKNVLEECAASGTIMRPYFGLRTPVQQAKFWRQSRPYADIENTLIRLEKLKCDYLADCIKAAGPQKGQWATNAIPGFSWHQYGRSMDCVWVRDTKPCWDTHVDGPLNGYHVYAAVGVKHGLTSLASIGDIDHLQMDKDGKPPYSIQEIDRMMKEKFGPVEGMV